MADVTFYVAIVTAATSVVSTSVPLVIGWAKDAGREKRAEAKELRQEQDKRTEERYSQCFDLLDQARAFRVLVQNTYNSDGPVLDVKAERVRQSAADIASLADRIGTRIPAVDTEASALVDAATQLASAAEEHKRQHGTALAGSAFTEFDQCVRAFKRAAQVAFGVLQERMG